MVNLPARWIGRVVLCVVAIVMLFIGLTALDRFLGLVLNSNGYFTAMTPGITEIYDNNEYTSIATISAQGLRNDIVAMPKPKGLYRILVIGDSFTYGQGVALPDTWVKQSEAILKSQGHTLELINAGKPGASPTDIRQICRAYENRLDIDAVVVGLFEDDLAQSVYRQTKLQQNRIMEFVDFTWPILARLNRRTIGYTRYPGALNGDTIYVSDAYKGQVSDMLAKNATILLKIDAKFRNDFLNGKINPTLFTNAIFFPDLFTYMLDSARMQNAVNALEYRLKLLQSRCVHNRPAVVLFIPSSEVISDAYVQAKKEMGYSLDNRMLTFDFDSILAPVMKRNGFTYISTVNALRALNCTDCYFLYDGHLTQRGNFEVANILVPKLRDILPTVH